MELTCEFYDGVNYTEEITELITQANMYNNPVVKSLKITRQQMFEDLKIQLKNKVYRWTWIFFNKGKYDKGEKELIGCISWGDVLDFLPKGEYAKVTDFSQVPTHSQVQSYFKHRSMQQFFAKYKPQEGMIAYGGAFGITPKYMGTQNLSYRMMLTTQTYLQQQGYKFTSVFAVNEVAKNVFRKQHNVDHYTVSLDDTFIVDSKIYPFEGSGISAEVYLSDVELSLRKLQELIDSRNRTRPRL